MILTENLLKSFKFLRNFIKIQLKINSIQIEFLKCLQIQ